MPTYDYECKKCNYTFEVFQSMSDDALTECPECKGEVRRLIGGGLGVIFKGDGFYVTDNRSSSPANGGKDTKNKDGKKESTAGTEAKSDGAKNGDKKDQSSSKEPVKSK